MSLFSSLYTGVSGIQTYGNSLQVVGDNIANVGTVGFKASRAEFAALLGQASAGGSQIGRGVSLEQVSTSFSQGSFNNTDRLTDLGIDGNGFFIVNDGQSRYYTRNGQFSINNQGYLVNSRGMRVQGLNFDPQGQSLGQGDIRVSQISSPPMITTDGVTGTGVRIHANLDSQGVIPPAFDDTSGTSAENTSNFSTTITVYDSLGNDHAVTVYFRKAQEPDLAAMPPVTNTSWEWYATVDGGDVTGGTAGTPFVGASGTLSFNSDGALVDQTTTASNFDFVGGATPGQVIGFNFGDDITGGGTGMAGSTMYAGASNVRSQSQDGFSAGSLASFDITGDGTITGFFTNGQVAALGQLQLADFANAQGLTGVGGGLYAETLASGAPVVGTPSVGGLGTVSPFTLELSNVDLASEFVNLVTMQRAYQANTRIISTVDQLLSDVVNLAR